MGACKQCGLPVEWKREPGSGKWQCHNAGTTVDHWDACSGERWRKIVRDGERFTAKRGKDTVTGYRYRGKEKLERISGKVVVGKDYKPLTCACDVLPWEDHPGCAEQAAWMAARDSGLAKRARTR